MAAITVRECVDLSDHLVMKPDGNFVELESFILNPESYVPSSAPMRSWISVKGHPRLIPLRVRYFLPISRFRRTF